MNQVLGLSATEGETKKYNKTPSVNLTANDGETAEYKTAPAVLGEGGQLEQVFQMYFWIIF